MLTVGATLPVVPVPVKPTVLDPATLLLLWAMLSVADFEPFVVGANVTLMVQLLPALTGALQPTKPNCATGSPVSVTLDTESGALPVLLTVMACGAEVVPVFTELKASEAGATAATGASPVPLKATVLGDPAL
jgi:hypothetical protein